MADKFPKRSKKHLRDALLIGLVIVIFSAAVGLLIYPAIYDWVYEVRMADLIGGYEQTVIGLTNDEIVAVRAEAEKYNQALMNDPFRWYTDEESYAEYKQILDATGTGIMGYVEIPDLEVKLPVYHGTEDAVLQTAIGHVEGSSFPIGGLGTHAVISGHSGLPTGKLFSALNELEIGDRFMIYTLGETLTYEVDQITTVLPDDSEHLAIEPDGDYVTLVTCTPIGINSHRLLVRGTRVNMEATPANTYVKFPVWVIIPIVAAIIFYILIIYKNLIFKRRSD